MDLLILGASARAAVQSARAAGFSPNAVDLFGDLDLQEAAAATARLSWADYPSGLESHAARMPAGPWIYTGSLENDPDLVDRIAASRPLWGNPGHVLRAVRDPSAVSSELERAGFHVPSIRTGSLPEDELKDRWLVKPYRSAAGLGIQFWGTTARDRAAGELPAGRYLQRYVPGTSFSAVFLGRGGASAFVGATRQAFGIPSDPFAYRGSSGPMKLPEETQGELTRLGQLLVDRFRLVGLFGVDMIFGRDRRLWIVEINPRYTASVEVLERVTGRRLIAEHARCFDAAPSLGDRPPGGVSNFASKSILYAAHDGTMPGIPPPWRHVADAGIELWISDLPGPGEPLRRGRPVLTINAAGTDSARVMGGVRQFGRLLDRRVNWRNAPD